MNWIIKVLSRHLLQGIEKTMGNLDQDSQCPLLDLNQGPEHKTREFLDQSVQFHGMLFNYTQ
jgi:hypothetical protein